MKHEVISVVAALLLIMGLNSLILAQPYFEENVLSTTVTQPWAIKAADLDGDGDNDIIFSQSNPIKLLWYKNLGDESFSEVITISQNVQIYDIEIVDIDNDDDMDIITPEYANDRIIFWENDGNEIFTGHNIVEDIENIRSIGITDIDDDDDPDVIGCYTTVIGEGIFWLENRLNETPNDFLQYEVDGVRDYVLLVDAADLNNDGYGDIVGIWDEDENDPQPTFIGAWINQGTTPITWNYTRIDANVEDVEFGFCSLSIGAINDDPLLDVVAGAYYDDRICWFKLENDDTWTDYDIDTDLDGVSSVYIADWNNDGLNDVVASGYFANEIRIWAQIPEDDLDFYPYTVDAMFPNSQCVFASNLDEDDELEILATSFSDNIISYWNTWNYQQSMALQGQYFELISLYVIPSDLDAEEVFGGITFLSIVYQNDGSIYTPNPPVNTIGDITMTEGYRIFCSLNSNLTVMGNNTLGENTQYSLIADQTYKWLGYPFNIEVDAAIALQEIVDDIDIIMNDDGLLWIPGLIRTLDDMVPGEGYMIIVDNNVTFNYHREAEKGVSSGDEVIEIAAIDGAPRPTGLPYVILVRFTDELCQLNPAIVEAYDGELLVGRNAVLNNNNISPVIAWGGSEEHNLLGFHEGNPATILVKNAEGEIIGAMEGQFDPEQPPGKRVHTDSYLPRFGEKGYAEVIAGVYHGAIPLAFNVASAFPNPFNPSFTLPFTLPRDGEVRISIFNVLGQIIYRSETLFRAGYHKFVFNSANMNSALNSGMYFIQVSYEDQTSVQKILMLK